MLKGCLLISKEGIFTGLNDLVYSRDCRLSCVTAVLVFFTLLCRDHIVGFLKKLVKMAAVCLEIVLLC